MKKLHQSHREMYFLIYGLKAKLQIILTDLDEGYSQDARRKVVDLVLSTEINRALEQALAVKQALEVLE